MKLHTMLNESIVDAEYKKLFDDLKSINRGGKTRSPLKMDKNGIINCANKDIPIQINRGVNHMFDADGVCKLKFGVFEGDFRIMDVSSIKSLKNMPHTVGGEMIIKYCHKITDFDGDQKSINILALANCNSLSSLSNIQTVKRVLGIFECGMIDAGADFSKCQAQYVKYTHSTMSSKFTSHHIKKMVFFSVTNINFLYLPDNLVELYIGAEKDQHFSFSNIDTLKMLEEFTFDDNLTKDNINGIIALLLCEKLKMYKHLFNVHEVDEILEKYLAINLAQSKDYIMDCAVELIDAGYPEAAEL